MSPAAGPDRPVPHRSGPGAAAPAVHIDRLRLRVAGLDAGPARTLARLVAESLEPGTLGLARNADFDRLQINVTASAAEQRRPDLLAQRIASELGRALARGRAPGSPDGEAVR